MRLEEHVSECNKLRSQAQILQKNLDDSLEWKNRFESSFSERESELEGRIKQLEQELRQTAETKLGLQQQLAQVSFRETEHLQKYETLVTEMQQSVAKLEKQNTELSEKLSAETKNSSTTAVPNAGLEEFKQKTVFLEASVAKLEQQLEKSRENLTLEREKLRQMQSDGWKKEKELSDVKIDLRIANRELKSGQAILDQYRQTEKEWNDRVKVINVFTCISLLKI